MTDRCPDTFLRDRPKCRGLDFLRQWLNLFRLLSPWRPRYLLVTRSASRRASGLGCSFAHFGAMISETSTSKDLTSMTETNDIKSIEGVIQSYLDGLYESDADKIASAFHPTSALTSVGNDGELAILPRDKWLDWVRARPSPKQRGLPRHDQVLTIDLVSPTMAYVKLKCAIPPRFFTDQLSLLKIDGRWQIAQKVFSTETRE
jgi:Putative lumazine-binding